MYFNINSLLDAWIELYFWNIIRLVVSDGSDAIIISYTIYKVIILSVAGIMKTYMYRYI